MRLQKELILAYWQRYYLNDPCIVYRNSKIPCESFYIKDRGFELWKSFRRHLLAPREVWEQIWGLSSLLGRLLWTNKTSPCVTFEAGAMGAAGAVPELRVEPHIRTGAMESELSSSAKSSGVKPLNRVLEARLRVMVVLFGAAEPMIRARQCGLTITSRSVVVFLF